MPSCRFCRAPINHVVLDLGVSPLANSYVPPARLMAMEPHYPLKAYLCERCGLVQLEAFASPVEIFGDYDYFSSYSKTWLLHAENYVQHMMRDYGITSTSQVVEAASNDGYLLQYFIREGVSALGVEPAANVAETARKNGIPTENAFFGLETGLRLKNQGYAADLALGNNVLAHVPDLNDFVAGFAVILKPSGILTLEFPHLLNLIQQTQFDTIYHEHYSYLSLMTVERVLKAHGLTVFDVEELPTHGGSLRVFACPESANRPRGSAVDAVSAQEQAAKLDRPEGYAGFAKAVEKVKLDLLEFIIDAKRHGKTIAAYGAAAKGNTLLNYTGIRQDLIPLIADASPHKQGKYLPGSRIPIVSPDELLAARPDYVLILPWNLRDEIMEQLIGLRSWGGCFVVAVPRLEIL